MKLAAGIPIFRIFDEDRAREFYCDYLGFTVDFEHRFDENAPLYMQVSRSSCVIHLSEHHGDATPGSTLRVEVADVDDFIGELKQKPYRYANPGIIDQPWNMRESAITDPFGNELVFYTRPNGISENSD